MKPDEESTPVNKAFLEMAAEVGLCQEELNDCAERWKAAHGVDLRDPLPEDMAHLENDALRLMALRRILEGYREAHKKGPQKKRRRGC